MRRLIAALFGLIGTGYDYFMNTRAGIFVNAGILFFLILFQWMMNYWGFPLINALIFFVLFGYTCYLWSDPAVIGAVEALEALRKDKSKKLPPLDENYYRLYLAYVLLWLSIVSMFVATLPFGWYLNFREAFTLTLTGLIFLSVIAWTAFFKWTKITIYKKIIKTYTYVGFLVCVWILIPASLKYWATGIDFYGAAGTSETAREFSKTGREVAKAIDQYNASKIAEIGKKLMEGTNLTPEERKFWINTEKKLKENSLQNLVSENVSRIDFSKLRLTPQVQAAKKQEISQPASQSVPVQPIAPAVQAQPAPAVYKAPEKDYSGEYRICWDGRYIYPRITTKGDNLSIDYTYNSSAGRMNFDGMKTGEGIYKGNYTFNGIDGNSFTREFELDLKNYTGWRLNPAGEKIKLIIIKLS